MTAPRLGDLGPAERRRLIAMGLVRALGITVALVTLYYIAPLNQLADFPLPASLAAWLLILIAVAVYQTRAIIRSTHPEIRAVEALAITAPLFLLLWAATYYLLAQSGPDNFTTHSLTRTDALYFSVVIFSTVGFGDIAATSQAGRLLITSQIILDLLLLGLGIRVFVGAVKLARQPQPPDQETPGTP